MNQRILRNRVNKIDNQKITWPDTGIGKGLDLLFIGNSFLVLTNHIKR